MTDTLGRILKNARETRRLTIAQVSKATRIRVFYIEALEADRFNDLPSPVHVRGFVRAYAEYLGLAGIDLILNDGFPLKSLKTSSIQETKPSIAEGEPGEGETLGLLIKQESNVTPIQPSDKSISDIFEQESGESLPYSLSIDQSIDQSDRINKSQLLFETIGKKLKKQREILSISLEEIETHSHVRKHYIEAIEAGEFNKLPSTVQAKGMLSNYASFLEIDLEEILLLYADALQAQRIEKQPTQNGRSDSSLSIFRFSALQRYISIDLIFGSVLIILLVFFAFWATGNVIDLYNSPSSNLSARSISDIILTPIQTKTPAGVDITEPALVVPISTSVDVTALSTIPANDSGLVQIHVIVLQGAWIRVTVDGTVVFEGRVNPGSAYPYSGNNQIEILTGNGSALQIIHNQTDLGIMGVFGEVVNRIYTQNSILQPTATKTPIPTISLTPTITPKLAKTPLPTQATIP